MKILILAILYRILIGLGGYSGIKSGEEGGDYEA